MKLSVEVLDASDLMPKDGNGSANPFVEVDFEGQKHRTQTKTKDLSPVWNEKFSFNVTDPNNLPNQTVDVVVYNDRKGGHHKNFLGRVRISGISIPLSEFEASVQRFPLDKRGLFSHISGDIGLKLYAVHDSSFVTPPSNTQDPSQPPPQGGTKVGDELNKKKKKGRETQSWHAIGTGKWGGGGGGAPPPSSGFQFNFPMKQEEKTRADSAQSQFGSAVTMRHMMGPKPSEFGLEETNIPLAGRMRYHRDKITSTYDLVEQMYYLYVNVVKAKDLPTMDITGSLDPYVEVKIGNYKGITKHMEKNQNPVWEQVFAFSKERLQANLLEVVLKDKDLVKDDFVGRLVIDLTEVPMRVPPDSPLAPRWYKLEDKKGETARGEIMLAVWMGTQADESFPDAWHSDAHSLTSEGLSNTRSRIYYSPKLFYLRVHVIEAQDLLPLDKTRPPETWVRMELGNQVKFTRPSSIRSLNPIWNEELLFVASEPLDELLIITVEDRIGPTKHDQLGKLVLPLSAAVPRDDHKKLVDPHWYNLVKPSSSSSVEEDKKKEVKFASKLYLRLCLEAGYHVLDESTHYSSDFEPSAKHLTKPNIGLLEVGILSAKNLLPMKTKDGRTTDAYCLAKYGRKWVRTRTVLDTLAPSWNEQYTWEVYDPCTVITIGVFDNYQINGGKRDDQRIGKVRIRLSTLEIDKIYTHYYPLLVLQPSGLKKTGELHLALRFTCNAWVNMVTLYAKPLLPKMHYLQPISVLHVDVLRRHAIQIVAERLKRAEPPVRKETVDYMLDVDYHMWSLRRSKSNFNRIMALLSGVGAVGKWFDDIRNWKSPVTTILVHVLFFILVCYPELILPTIFLYMFIIGIWNYRYRPRKPPHMDTKLSHAEWAHPDELDEEFDTFPSSRPSDIVRMRYDRLKSVAGRMQTVAGDLATQGERAQAILSWRDPRATAIFIIFSLIVAVFLYVTPFQVVAVLVGIYMLRHPRFRAKRMPSLPFNFFKRLPAKSDMLL
ncbi:FT-interacting protein 3-like [Tasmannia lanceolata]|uniref:FT-interacting protein 3-like n=1 Tax=Tasmannia lanceolata TaxID=3420 RepID=UPI004063EF1E